MNWTPLYLGIWDSNIHWRDELYLIQEDKANGFIFGAHRHRCNFAGKWMYAMIVVNLNDQTYANLGWTETNSIHDIVHDTKRQIVYYVFSSSKIESYQSQMPFSHIADYKIPIPGEVYGVELIEETGGLKITTEKYESYGIDYYVEIIPTKHPN